ncbi:unnamed protein product [Rotaria sp. Silwood2]|nr:unnamed protein product [Rotaria sp. Silwood2]
MFLIPVENLQKVHLDQEEKKKEVNIDIDIQTQMDYDDSHAYNLSSLQQDEDQQQNLLNISSASADTIIAGNLNRKEKLKKRPIDYFTRTDDNAKVKCSICLHEYKYDPFSDSNLRSHLGFKHGLYNYLFPSQIKQRERHERKSTISPHLKQQLDAAAIECIVKDGLSFGTFRRAGMQHFLETIEPGYRGPTRQTVRKHLDKKYQERRSLLKNKLKDVPHISLTTDLWVNSRRHHFLVITAHYVDEHHQHISEIISFRRFRGRHLSARLKLFIINEIKKLNIESKIISITTDSGSDIKAATSSYEFGLRFSCDAHNINRTISTGLGLWNISTSKSKKPPITTAPNASSNDSDDELEGIRLIDYDPTYDEWIDDDENSDLDDEDYVPMIFDESESDSYSDSSDEDDDDSTHSQSQQDRQSSAGDKEQELQLLLSSPDELKNKISSLLKKNRKLIKMINKSSNLTLFVRNEIERKQMALDATNGPTNEEKIKINHLVNDFYIRWSSTYIMLIRLLMVQSIINNITYSPHTDIGLTTKQVKKLRSLRNSHLEWELLESLSNVLAPFYLGTKCLSGRKYTTLSLSYWITQNLFIYLTSETPNATFENELKGLLLNKFNLYFNTKMTNQQKCAKLVAAYLDPFTLAEMSTEEINEAEALIMREAETFAVAKKTSSTATATREQLQQPSTTSSSSSINSSKQSSLSTISRFRTSCRSSSIDSAATPKQEKKETPLTLKQELSAYISTSRSYEDYQSYWNEKKTLLPILSSFTRRYNCIPATSVASESAFSVAGYIDRKQRASLLPTTLRYLMLLKT